MELREAKRTVRGGALPKYRTDTCGENSKVRSGKRGGQGEKSGPLVMIRPVDAEHDIWPEEEKKTERTFKEKKSMGDNRADLIKSTALLHGKRRHYNREGKKRIEKRPFREKVSMKGRMEYLQSFAPISLKIPAN